MRGMLDGRGLQVISNFFHPLPTLEFLLHFLWRFIVTAPPAAPFTRASIVALEKHFSRTVNVFNDRSMTTRAHFNMHSSFIRFTQNGSIYYCFLIRTNIFGKWNFTENMEGRFDGGQGCQRERGSGVTGRVATCASNLTSPDLWRERERSRVGNWDWGSTSPEESDRSPQSWFSTLTCSFCPRRSSDNQVTFTTTVTASLASPHASEIL